MAIRRIAVSALVIVAVGGLAVGGRKLVDHYAADPTVEALEPEPTTAIATVRDLVIDYEATGSVVYEPAVAVTAPTGGTVTAIVAAGSVVGPSDVIARIDDVPVVWLAGAVPAWRAMSIGDVGTDVAQLETALAGFGYNSDGQVTVDDEYTWATASMVDTLAGVDRRTRDRTGRSRRRCVR